MIYKNLQFDRIWPLSGLDRKGEKKNDGLDYSKRARTLADPPQEDDVGKCHPSN